MANPVIHYVLWASILRCGGQQDVKDVSETIKSIQMTRIAPDMQVRLDQRGTRMTVIPGIPV